MPGGVSRSVHSPWSSESLRWRQHLTGLVVDTVTLVVLAPPWSLSSGIYPPAPAGAAGRRTRRQPRPAPGAAKLRRVTDQLVVARGPRRRSCPPVPAPAARCIRPEALAVRWELPGKVEPDEDPLAALGPRAWTRSWGTTSRSATSSSAWRAGPTWLLDLGAGTRVSVVRGGRGVPRARRGARRAGLGRRRLDQRPRLALTPTSWSWTPSRRAWPSTRRLPDLADPGRSRGRQPSTTAKPAAGEPPRPSTYRPSRLAEQHRSQPAGA